MLSMLRDDIAKVADGERARFLAGFFKTGKGGYGEGDVFHGITVPEARKIAARYKDVPFEDVLVLLRSSFHEERLIALLMLIRIFRQGDQRLKRQIYDLYLSNTAFVDNWDLVDTSAGRIVGEYLKYRNDRSILRRLARSKSLWERRISIIATFPLISDLREHEDAFAVTELLLHDEEDLIQKAVGWTLREVGKRISEQLEEDFLKPRYKGMPRTALRYAIERFEVAKRQRYLSGVA